MTLGLAGVDRCLVRPEEFVSEFITMPLLHIKLRAGA